MMRVKFRLLIGILCALLVGCGNKVENLENNLIIVNQSPIIFKSIEIRSVAKENHIDALISGKCGYGDEIKFYVEKNFENNIKIVLNPQEGYSISKEIKKFDFDKTTKYIIKIKNNEIYLEYCEL